MEEPKPPTCLSCPYWEASACDEGNGWCKRHAPRPLVVPADDLVHLPATNAEHMPAYTNEDDWCGEHPDFPAHIIAFRNYWEWLRAAGDAS